MWRHPELLPAKGPDEEDDPASRLVPGERLLVFRQREEEEDSSLRLTCRWATLAEKEGRDPALLAEELNLALAGECPSEGDVLRPVFLGAALSEGQRLRLTAALLAGAAAGPEDRSASR